MATATFLILISGLICLFLPGDKTFQEFAFGQISFGLGMIGLLKSAMEMYEHHRKNKPK